MNILFLDLETTGLEYDEHGIIEFAAEYHVDGDRVTSYKCKMGGEFFAPIDLKALKVNRTSLSELNSRKSPADQVRGICDWLLSLESNKPIRICGQNVHFDVYFLKNLLKSYQIEGFNNLFSFKLIDTSDRANMLIDAGLIEIPEGQPKSLENIAVALGFDVDMSKVHTADYDAELSAKVYYKMQELLRGLSGK